MQTQIDTDVLIGKATNNVRDIVSIALKHDSTHRAIVIYDTENELARILTQAYRNTLSEALFLDFNAHTKEEIIAHFDTLAPRDLVVLIQSTDFRLNEFRIRIQLFQRKLKVIDHLHLYRNTPNSWETYIDALAYDPFWYRKVGPALKSILDTLHMLSIETPNTRLVVTEGLEIAKLNIGDYTGMENIGGTFPIGEVFTESKQLESMNGSLMIQAFATSDFHIAFFDPFRIDVKDGLVIGYGENTPESFKEIVAKVTANERPIIREIGFGLNRAITAERPLRDITAFERMHGLHVSLGEKHTVYKKQGITSDKTRFHVDLFPVVSSVYADARLIFKDNTYQV